MSARGNFSFRSLNAMENKKTGPLGIPSLKLNREMSAAWFKRYAAAISVAEVPLTEMDRLIGDADHGVNMKRGMVAVLLWLKETPRADLHGQFRGIATTLMSSVGGAAGPLYGAFFLQAGQTLLHKEELRLSDLVLAVEAGYRGLIQLGKATPGEKTMVDTFAAVLVSLRLSCDRHEDFQTAVAGCAEAAHRAAVGTIPMIARKGRASYLVERSAGFQDPGAASAALLFEALAETVSARVSLSLPPIHSNRLSRN